MNRARDSIASSMTAEAMLRPASRGSAARSEEAGSHPSELALLASRGQRGDFSLEFFELFEGFRELRLKRPELRSHTDDFPKNRFAPVTRLYARRKRGRGVSEKARHRVVRPCSFFIIFRKRRGRIGIELARVIAGHAMRVDDPAERFTRRNAKRANRRRRRLRRLTYHQRKPTL